MKTTQPGLMGNFVSLHEVVKAVADRIAISDEEADRCRGPNRLREESPFEVQIVRSQIKSAMAQSRAAGVLLEPLNLPAAQRPAWYDSTPGYPKLKDAVSDRGMDILIDLSRSEAVLRRRERLPQQVESQVGDQALLPAHSIGFEIEELISHLESAQVPHSLKTRESAHGRSPAPEPASMMGGDSVVMDLAPQSPVGLKESESLTDYLSRTAPPPRVFVERVDDELGSPSDVNVVSATDGDTLSDEEGSSDRGAQQDTASASEPSQAMLDAAWQRFEGSKRNAPGPGAARSIALMALKTLELEDRRNFFFEDVQGVITELFLSGANDRLLSVGVVDGEWQFLVGTAKKPVECKQKPLTNMLRRWRSEYNSILETLASGSPRDS